MTIIIGCIIFNVVAATVYAIYEYYASAVIHVICAIVCLGLALGVK